MAGKVWDRFTVHYTPKHGSWLNQAEIELAVFSRQCLGSRRIPDLGTLRRESRAWIGRANRARKKINWTFDRKAARRKFGYKRNYFKRPKTQKLCVKRQYSAVHRLKFYLGNRYESGDGVPRELDRARRYFRLCPAQGVAQCQFRLASLLFNAPDRPERDYVQAVAWFKLAGDQGIAEANEIAQREVAKFTPAQMNWMTTLKAQLVRR